MSVKPLRDFVVVTKNEEATKTPGGLYVPSTVEEKVVTGTVKAVGSGKVSANGTVVPLEVNEGDVVAFNRHMAVELKAGSENVLLLKEEHIMCVFK